MVTRRKKRTPIMIYDDNLCYRCLSSAIFLSLISKIFILSSLWCRNLRTTQMGLFLLVFSLGSRENNRGLLVTIIRIIPDPPVNKSLRPLLNRQRHYRVSLQHSHISIYLWLMTRLHYVIIPTECWSKVIALNNFRNFHVSQLNPIWRQHKSWKVK